jgi:hydrogenase maturation protease
MEFIDPDSVKRVARAREHMLDFQRRIFKLEYLLEDLSRDSPYSEEEVEFVDGGTQGLALLGYLNDRKAIIILDAVGLGAAPGTVHLLGSDEVVALGGRRAGTSHEGNALELLATARLFWEGSEE